MVRCRWDLWKTHQVSLFISESYDDGSSLRSLVRLLFSVAWCGVYRFRGLGVNASMDERMCVYHPSPSEDLENIISRTCLSIYSQFTQSTLEHFQCHMSCHVPDASDRRKKVMRKFVSICIMLFGPSTIAMTFSLERRISQKMVRRCSLTSDRK